MGTETSTKDAANNLKKVEKRIDRLEDLMQQLMQFQLEQGRRLDEQGRRLDEQGKRFDRFIESFTGFKAHVDEKFSAVNAQIQGIWENIDGRLKMLEDFLQKRLPTPMHT